MPLALPLVAVGLLALVLATIAAVILTPVIEGLAREVPVVGGYIARGTKAAVDWAAAKISAYARTFTGAVSHWLHGLQSAAQQLADDMARFAVATVDALDQLTHVTVHEIVKAFVNPVREAVHDLRHDLDATIGSVGAIYTESLADFRGIEAGVTARVDHLHDLVRNVDLPLLGRQLGDAIGEVERDATTRVGELRHYSEGEFGRLWDRLDKIPLQQLLEGLALSGATAALVEVIANESGLSRRECRGKVKNICSTDPAAWEHLLAAVVPLFAFPGLAAMVQLGQQLTEALLPVVRDLAGGGGERG